MATDFIKDFTWFCINSKSYQIKFISSKLS